MGLNLLSCSTVSVATSPDPVFLSGTWQLAQTSCLGLAPGRGGGGLHGREEAQVVVLAGLDLSLQAADSVPATIHAAHFKNSKFIRKTCC